jgi:hypothetical protein
VGVALRGVPDADRQTNRQRNGLSNLRQWNWRTDEDSITDKEFLLSLPVPLSNLLIHSLIDSMDPNKPINTEWNCVIVGEKLTNRLLICITSHDISRLMALVHPHLASSSRKVITCDYFIDSLNEPDFALKVRERNPTSLDEALRVALQLVAWIRDTSRQNMKK